MVIVFTLVVVIIILSKDKILDSLGVRSRTSWRQRGERTLLLRVHSAFSSLDLGHFLLSLSMVWARSGIRNCYVTDEGREALAALSFSLPHD